MVGDTIVVGYADGPCQVSIIHLAKVWESRVWQRAAH
jgi:hypothetical protein